MYRLRIDKTNRNGEKTHFSPFLRLLTAAFTAFFIVAVMTACASEQGESESGDGGMTEPYKRFLALMSGRVTISRTEIGEGGYTYKLERGVLAVFDAEETEVWRSAPEWWVDDFRLRDVDGDGAQDFLFSLWKSYRFGNAKPARMENDDESVRNHLFLYTIAAGRVKPVWCSSDLQRPVYQFDLAYTGEESSVSSGVALRTEEGAYTDDFSFTDSSAHKYVWEGWGFVPID